MAENVGTISYKLTIDKGTFNNDVDSIEKDVKSSTDKADGHLGVFESNVGRKMMAVGKVIAASAVAAGAAFTAFSGNMPVWYSSISSIDIFNFIIAQSPQKIRKPEFSYSIESNSTCNII